MNATHTPGPWNHVKGRVCSNGSQDSDDKVAEVRNPSADGALIAAAPDLLATLRAISDAPHDSEYVLRLALGAIAKAEGK